MRADASRMGIHVMGDLRASRNMCGNAYRAQRSVSVISPSNLDHLLAGLWWAIGARESRKWARPSAPDGEDQTSSSTRVSHSLVRSTSQLRAAPPPAVSQHGATLSARRHRSRTQGRYLPATGRLLACGGRAQVRGGPNGPANGSRRHLRAFSEAQAAEHAYGRKICVQIFI